MNSTNAQFGKVHAWLALGARVESYSQHGGLLCKVIGLFCDCMLVEVVKPPDVWMFWPTGRLLQSVQHTYKAGVSICQVMFVDASSNCI